MTDQADPLMMDPVVQHIQVLVALVMQARGGLSIPGLEAPHMVVLVALDTLVLVAQHFQALVALRMMALVVLVTQVLEVHAIPVLEVQG